MKKHNIENLFMILGFTVIFAAAAGITYGLNVKGGRHSPIVYFRDVAISNYTAISNVTISLTNGGTFTNGSFTFFYRVNGTNSAGRMPVSAIVTQSFTGDATNTNAVVITWESKDGIRRYVVERSEDGINFTNTITFKASVTSYIDKGTDIFTVGFFTNDVAVTPEPEVPWPEMAGTNDTTRWAESKANTNVNMNNFDLTNANLGRFVIIDILSRATVGVLRVTGSIDGGGVADATNLSLINGVTLNIEGQADVDTLTVNGITTIKDTLNMSSKPITNVLYINIENQGGISNIFPAVEGDDVPNFDQAKDASILTNDLPSSVMSGIQIEDLGNVSSDTNPAVGDVQTWNGSSWSNVASTNTETFTWISIGAVSTGNEIDGFRVMSASGTIQRIWMTLSDRGNNGSNVVDISIGSLSGSFTTQQNAIVLSTIYTDQADRPTLEGLSGSSSDNAFIEAPLPAITNFDIGDIYSMDVDISTGLDADLTIMMHVLYN